MGYNTATRIYGERDAVIIDTRLSVEYLKGMPVASALVSLTYETAR